MGLLSETTETVRIDKGKFDALVDSLPHLFQGPVRSAVQAGEPYEQFYWWVKAGAAIAVFYLVVKVGRKVIKV